MMTQQDTAIQSKTKELCQAILDEPSFQSIRQRIDAFLDNENARAQYEGVVSKGQALQEKQHRAEQLSDTEIADFEKERDALLLNPVARGFIDAQEEMHEFKHSITKLVNKTIELGRIPSDQDLQESCGHGGCGCSH